MKHIEILHIEDKKVWLDYVQDLLNNSRYHLEKASTIREAQEKLDARQKHLSEKQYDLLIVDLALPDLGKDPLNTLRKVIFSLSQDKTQPYGRIPIIILTAHELPDKQVKDAFNSYPGWIWGWFEKTKIDEDKFIQNITSGVKAQKQYQDIFFKTVTSQRHKSRRSLLKQMIVTGTLLLLFWLLVSISLIQFLGWEHVEPIAYIGSIISYAIIFYIQIFYFYKKNKELSVKSVFEDLVTHREYDE